MGKMSNNYLFLSLCVLSLSLTPTSLSRGAVECVKRGERKARKKENSESLPKM